MLQPIKHILASKRLVLASGSPRRKEILENIGLKFEVIPSTFEETLDKNQFKHPYEYVIETARGKATEVCKRLNCDKPPPDVIIGADTVVTMDGKIYEKPRDEQDAFEILSGFSGRCHTVYTGVILIARSQDGTLKTGAFYEQTDVNFAKLTPEVIKSYIQTGEPMDKAGGYGIQAAGGTLVESIHGDYFNVMGFPLHHFSKELVKLLETND